MTRGGTEMEREAEAVIIGGGIVGCATAYYLARRGLRPVLVEKGDVGGAVRAVMTRRVPNLGCRSRPTRSWS